MEYGVANHHIGKFAREWHFLNETHFEIFRGQLGSERCSELANVLDSLGVSVHCKYFAALAKQVHKVSAIAAAGVEHAHALVDISAEDLIEDVNVDLAELVLNGHWLPIPMLAFGAAVDSFKPATSGA